MYIPLHTLIENLSQQAALPVPDERLDEPAPLSPPIPPPGTDKRTRMHGPYSGPFVPLDGQDRVTRTEGQAEVWQRCLDYLSNPNPEGPLIIATNTGFGKTFLMARLASMLGEQGRRVFYAGPRRAFFDVVLDEVKKQGFNPAMWRAWLPRQDAAEAEERGSYETCRYAPAINGWLARGYSAIGFCKQYCGWDYIGGECRYYAQKEIQQPIIYGHHNHLFLGNMLMAEHKFDLLIGDEIALSSAVLNPILVSEHEARAVVSADSDNAVDALLARCGDLLASGESYQGRALLEALGGTEAILRACALWELFDDDSQWVPEVRLSIDGRLDEQTPPNFVNDFFRLLKRETLWARDNEGEYLPRLIIRAHGRGQVLEMLLRRSVHPSTPKHVIWCDATPQQDVYDAIFGRPVQIVHARMPRKATVIQVATRANGKTSLLDESEEGASDAVARLQQTTQQVWHLVEQRRRELGTQSTGRWGAVTYKGATGHFESYHAETMHFGGARGENDFATGEQMDVGFVIGTPLPRLTDLVRTATMLWQHRMEPWDIAWSDEPYPFKGVRGKDDQGVWYWKSGFWASPHLMAVLWLTREAEILQMVGRYRPATHSLPVYLLSSLPIDDLMPDEIWDIADVFGAPEGSNPFTWSDVLRIAEVCQAEGLRDPEYRWITADLLERELDLKRRSALRYLRYIADHLPGWERGRSVLRGQGKSVVAAPVPPGLVPPEGYSAVQWAQIVRYTKQMPDVTTEAVREAFGVTLTEAERIIRELVKQVNITATPT